MTKPHRFSTIVLAIAAIATWISIDSDIESACAGDQACIAASL